MSVLNLEYIESVCDGDMEMRREIFGLFVQQMEAVEAELQTPFDVEDYDAMARQAHKVRASALTMGMTEMAEALKKIEIIGKKLFVRSDMCNKDASYKELYISQINGLSPELDEWTEQNMTSKSVQQLIDFCKLRAKEARDEVLSLLP